MKNIRDRYGHVYIFLVRKQKKLLSQYPQNFCAQKLEVICLEGINPIARGLTKLKPNIQTFLYLEIRLIESVRHLFILKWPRN